MTSISPNRAVHLILIIIYLKPETLAGVIARFLGVYSLLSASRAPLVASYSSRVSRRPAGIPRGRPLLSVEICLLNIHMRNASVLNCEGPLRRKACGALAPFV